MDHWTVLNLVLPIAGMLTGVVVIGTLSWTARYWVQRHYAHRAGEMGPEVKAQLDRVDERMAMLEEVAGRVQDLEERVDFAERVLVRQREAGQLPPGAE